MRLLGFYIGRHDSSIAYADLSGSVRYYKLERLIQSKHKRGSLDWIKELCREEGIVPDVICFSDGNRNSLGECPLGELAAVSTALADWQDVPCFCIDHHYAHILSAWPVMNDGDTHFVKRGICVDGRGDHQIKCSVIEHPFDLGRARIIHADENADFCLAFNKIGAILRLQGGELDFAGKIMGMYAYGKINEAFMKQYAASMHNGAVSDIVDIPFCGSRFDWVATMHASMEDYLDEIFSRFRFGSDPMVYAGGCAQNTVFNRRLLRGGALIIPPHCYDGGISLGCLKYIALRYGVHLDFSGFPFAQVGDDVGYAEKSVIDTTVSLLARGNIVGWCQGRGEIGPRALGHRSILMNPAIPGGKDILNRRVKKREFWRPFGASILIEDAQRIMTNTRACPYMLHVTEVAPLWKQQLQCVIHRDNTCRFQTVADTKELRTFRLLLKRFKEETGIPALLNTSFNIAGKPIANGMDDIEKAFVTLDLDAICIGNQLKYKC